MTIAWVIGSRGLLGSALCRALRLEGTSLFLPSQTLRWDEPAALALQIGVAVEAFSHRAKAFERWEVYWAAGVGTMGSDEAAMEQEIVAFSLVLRLLGSLPGLVAARGAIAFASSAGAIYAGSLAAIITENTEPSPTTAYARAKLRQESLAVAAFAKSGVPTLIARISTLYGQGQASDKKQGLLTHIARSILHNKPIQIYVPYDTIRDYIAADDAAGAMVSALRATRQESRVVVKIVASEHPTTIAEIISVFRRVARRAPRVVTSASRLSGLYARRVQFRSIVLQEPVGRARSSLLVGVARLMASERATFMAGPRHTK